MNSDDSLTKQSKSDGERMAIKRRSKSSVFELEKRAQRLERFLKATKPIESFIERVNELEKRLASANFPSTPTLSTYSREMSQDTSSISSNCLEKPVQEIVKDSLFISHLSDIFISSVDTEQVVMSREEIETTLKKPSLLQSIFIAITVFHCDADYGYNLKSAETFYYQNALKYLPQVYAETDVRGVQGMFLLAVYEYKLNKMNSCHSRYDQLFRMYQILAAKLLPPIPTNSIVADHLHSPLESESVKILVRLWPWVLSGKKFSTFLSGEPIQIKEIDNMLHNIQDLIVRFDFEPLIKSEKGSNQYQENNFIWAISNYVYDINVKIFYGISKHGLEPSEVITKNLSTQKEVEEKILGLMKMMDTNDYSATSYQTILQFVLCNLNCQQKLALQMGCNVHHLLILLNWPSILSYPIPTELSPSSNITLFNAANEVYRILEDWKHACSESHLQFPQVHCPIASQMINMSAIIFLNGWYFSQTESPLSSINYLKKLNSLEDILYQHIKIWDGGLTTWKLMQAARDSFGAPRRFSRRRRDDLNH